MNEIRKGKIRCTRGFVDGGLIPRAFEALDFTPMYIYQWGFHGDIEYVGISKMFDELDEGDIIPEYVTKFTAHADQEGIKTITATVERI